MSATKTAFEELRVTIRNANKDAIAVIQLRIAVKAASQMYKFAHRSWYVTLQTILQTVMALLKTSSL